MRTKHKEQQTLTGPIIVLTASRSGSTLLRLILDSHPDIAAPPESGLGAACASLARVACVLFAGHLPGGSEASFATIVERQPEVAANIRSIVDVFYTSYAEYHGKTRWCDKSLDNFAFARLLSKVFPEAKFICLYRHCMDVVASGAEATPWGLNGFGFADFAVHHPGNNVAAIANYWLATVSDILAFEKEQTERCFRIRYEDLVSDPESRISSLLEFLGATQVPGITSACFQSEHDGNGPGDQKIWVTSSVTTDSIGRGNQVPVQALPPPMLAQINEVLGELGYRTVDEDWNRTVGRTDPRTDAAERDRLVDPAVFAERDAVAERIASFLQAAPATPGRGFRHQPTDPVEHIHLVVEAGSGPASQIVWQAGTGRVSCDSQTRSTGGAEAFAPCTLVVGEASTWTRLLAGTSNIYVETSAGRIRCINTPNDISPIAELTLVTELLALR